MENTALLTKGGLARKQMSYFQEDLNDNPFFSDEAESCHVLPRNKVIFESDSDDKDSFVEEARYNPSRPAYLQFPLGPEEMPETVQSRKQAQINSKKRKGFPQKILTAHSDICVLLFCTIYTAHHKQTNKSDNDDFIPTGLSMDK